MDPTLLIGDIVERDETAAKPVEFPSGPISATGFPQHKRRWKSSAFKQQRNGGASQSNQAQAQEPTQPQAFEEVERQRIDRENRQKLNDMTPQEISRAQDDLLNGLNPALIQRLLQRATIDEPDPNSPFNIPEPREPQPASASSPPEIRIEDVPKAATVEDETADVVKPEPNIESTPAHAPPPPPPTARAKSTKKIPDNYDEDRAPAQIPPDLFPITDLPKSTHFPVPPSLPDLDPSDPNFLATLHEKYFPNLPADPSKLAWMAPVPTQDSPADKDSPYYPHPEISVSALRFDFRGRFLSPRVSRSIPSSKGLHHHGEAPEAAGYTITELARLARSAVPAQRCIAFQTLGRILYRLGRGEWGTTPDHPIAMGVWSAVKEGRVLESLTEASMAEGGHRGSRAYAVEALWLFEKGGWREKLQGR
ncbi:RPAP1-like protein [Trichoderma novae-zelandiae]